MYQMRSCNGGSITNSAAQKEKTKRGFIQNIYVFLMSIVLKKRKKQNKNSQMLYKNKEKVFNQIKKTLLIYIYSFMCES